MVFHWCVDAANNGTRNWFWRIKKQFLDLDLLDILNENYPAQYVSSQVANAVSEKEMLSWKARLNREQAVRGQGRNKLRTYPTYKFEYKVEHYVKHVVSCQERSALAKVRCGVAPIQLEIGGYMGQSEEDRICPLCKRGIESECHVVIECELYDDLRTELLHKALANIDNFIILSPIEQFTTLMSCVKLQTLWASCSKQC